MASVWIDLAMAALLIVAGGTLVLSERQIAEAPSCVTMAAHCAPGGL